VLQGVINIAYYDQLSTYQFKLTYKWHLSHGLKPTDLKKRSLFKTKINQNPILVASPFPQNRNHLPMHQWQPKDLVGGAPICHVINDVAIRQVAAPAHTSSPLLNVGHL
jgi:hypothetical protein